MERHRFTRVLISLLVLSLFLGHSVGLWHLFLLDPLENMAYDARIQLTLPASADPRIVIIDIDDASLAEEGQWPWGRDRLARLVERLFDDYGVRVLGIDVVFAERDESAGLRVLEELADDDPALARSLDRIRPRLDRDRIFAEALENRPVVLGYYLEGGSGQNSETTTGTLPSPPPVIAPPGVTPEMLALPRASRYGANLAILQNSAHSGGFFDNPLVDADGIYRRAPMLQVYNGEYYESLSLAVIRTLLDDPPLELIIPDRDQQQLEALRVGGFTIPVDAQGAALVPYHGPRQTFRYISAADVLHGRADPGQLMDTIALLGTSAPGLLDLQTTPVQNIFPGVEIHANLIAGILHQNFLHRPAYTLAAEFLLLTAIGLLMALLFPLLSPLTLSSLTLALLSLILVGNLYAWSAAGWVLPLASPLLLIILLFSIHAAYGYFVEARGKRMIKRMFGQYVPPELVDEMSADPDSFSLEGESREMTVLFTDIRNFSVIAENMDPRELTQLMNELLTPLTAIIHRYRGTIDKYMGDAIMAFWGAPLSDPEHVRHAVEAALDITGEMRHISRRFSQHGWPELGIGAGINTGEMNVGNMGSRFRVAYTVMGDAVNLASRLEDLTRQYEVDIIVSESVVRALPHHAFRELDRVRVKGNDRPVDIFEPLGPRNSLDATTLHELDLYHRALRHYRLQDWELAEKALLELRDHFPGNPIYATYLERIANCRCRPPGSDWDGVYTAPQRINPL